MVQTAHLSTGELHKYDKAKKIRKCASNQTDKPHFSTSTTEYKLQTNPKKEGAERDEDLVVQGDAGGGADAHLAGAERAEVVGGLGDDVGEELHHEPPLQLCADGDVHEAAGVPLRHSFPAGAAALFGGGGVAWDGGGAEWGEKNEGCFLECSDCLFDSFFARGAFPPGRGC